MSSNNDNAMARFLFAILQQKCLKDIDWNKVAHNPVLAQEITNGHAARMRYSRFRAAMLGLEPQRRNRANPNSKSRVSKKKKKDGAVRPKKEEDEEKRSGSGIGSIKRENIADADTKPVKTERRSIANPSPALPQPPASMTTPATMKTEPGLANPFNQKVQQSSVHAATSPRVKQERPVTAAAAAAIPEPSPFGVVSTAPTTSSASSTPYIDGHHRMQMRLMTPCSDSDGVGMQGFLPHSPGPLASDLLHTTQHQHQHHQHTVGAGSPPLSTAAPSPYDFSQCLDVASSPSPWHSQQHSHAHHHHHHHPAHGLPHNPAAYTTAGFGGLGSGVGVGGYALDAGYTNPFCNDHHHHHDHDNGAHHHIADPLGLHGGAGATSLFRERELELQMDRMTNNALGGGQMTKHEWEEGFDGI